MLLTPCPGCGANLPGTGDWGHRYVGASVACWEIFASLINANAPPLAPAPMNAIITDAYMSQHPGEPTPQAIQSVAVHALVLYAVFEQNLPIDQVLWLRQYVLRENIGPKRGRFSWLTPPSALSQTITIVQPATHTPSSHRFSSAVCRGGVAHLERGAYRATGGVVSAIWAAMIGDYRLTTTRLRVIKPRTMAKIVEPIIDQMTGNVCPPMVTGSSSGSPNNRANHSPTNAPINPTTADTRQPPNEYPARACPMPPAIAEMITRIINSMSVRCVSLKEYIAQKFSFVNFLAGPFVSILSRRTYGDYTTSGDLLLSHKD